MNSQVLLTSPPPLIVTQAPTKISYELSGGLPHNFYFYAIKDPRNPIVEIKVMAKDPAFRTVTCSFLNFGYHTIKNAYYIYSTQGTFGNLISAYLYVYLRGAKGGWSEYYTDGVEYPLYNRMLAKD